MSNPSAYRDGLGALRQDAREAIARGLARGARLRRRDRRRLPRRLRLELDDHEAAFAIEAATVKALREQEGRLADYEDALGVAETWLESRRDLLHRGRVHYAPAALTLVAAIAPIGTMMALRFGALAVHCGARARGMPSTPNWQALLHTDAPRCVAESDIDCATLCQLRGLCGERDGTCVADDPELCRSSVGCAVEGACTLRREACVPFVEELEIIDVDVEGTGRATAAVTPRHGDLPLHGPEDR